MLPSMSMSRGTPSGLIVQQRQGALLRPAPLRASLIMAAVRPSSHGAGLQEGRTAVPRDPRTATDQINSILPFRRPSPQPFAAPQHAFELDNEGNERLKLEPSGWNHWEWRGHKINWTAAGAVCCLCVYWVSSII
jgi:hypothetical protein